MIPKITGVRSREIGRRDLRRAKNPNVKEKHVRDASYRSEMDLYKKIICSSGSHVLSVDKVLPFF